jgi:hypothetical protein
MPSTTSHDKNGREKKKGVERVGRNFVTGRDTKQKPGRQEKERENLQASFRLVGRQAQPRPGSQRSNFTSSLQARSWSTPPPLPFPTHCHTHPLAECLLLPKYYFSSSATVLLSPSLSTTYAPFLSRLYQQNLDHLLFALEFKHAEILLCTGEPRDSERPAVSRFSELETIHPSITGNGLLQSTNSTPS